MKKSILHIAMLSLASVFYSCSEKNEVAPAEAVYQISPYQDTLTGNPNCEPLITTFYAGQTIDAGTITVSNDNTNLYVTFTTIGGWQMKESHLYVGPLSGLPSTPKGNPKIGNFPYKQEHEAGVNSYTYTIPLSSLGESDCIAVAAHAAVVQLSETGEELEGETAWGAGTRLTNPGSWATYFKYCICWGEGGEGTGESGN